MTTAPLAIRARVLRAWDHRDTTTVLGEDGRARLFSGDSAALARALLGFLTTPRTREEVRAHIAALTGATVLPGGVVDEALASLEQAGAVHAPAAPASPPARRTRLVLGVTGAVAAAFAPGLVELLLGRGFEVRAAMTRNARRFVTALALEALTHHPVVTSLWPTDARAPVPHLDLAGWAQLFVVYPASASSISRLAQGSCADVVAAAAISTRAPVLLVPSMNVAMLTAPAVARNLETLREDGFHLAHPCLGMELAEAPRERAPRLGAAPPLGAVVEIIEALAALRLAPGDPVAGA